MRRALFAAGNSLPRYACALVRMPVHNQSMLGLIAKPRLLAARSPGAVERPQVAAFAAAAA